MNKFSARLKQYRSNVKENGFSMLEAVVVVGVLLALAVGGFIAYGQITDNAKKAATESAAASVYTAALAANMDGDSNTTVFKVIDEYNKSQTAVQVTATQGATPVAIAADTTTVDDKTLVVTATNDGKTAVKGKSS